MTQPSASALEEATRPSTPSPSGRLLLRMAPGLHAELARAAEREGVSLNGFITTRLADAVGWRQGERPATAQPTQNPPSKAVLWALVANAAAVVLAAVAALVIVLVAILA